MAGPRGLAAALLAALALGACGEKSEPDLSDIPPPRATSTERPELEIVATGDREAVRYRVTGDARPGSARITLRNELARPTSGRMVRTDEALSPAELAGRLARLPRVGPPRTAPGRSSTVTVQLRPGTYYVVGDQPVSDRPTSFIVTPP